MEPFAHHIVLRLRNDQVIAPDLAERRLLARVVLERTRGLEVLCFGLPDNHLHLEVVGSRREGLEIARRIEISLKRRLFLPVGFAPAYAKPILTQFHLRNGFRYILCQGKRHRLVNDPDREGTNLPDLLGLRNLEHGTAAAARRWLPRLTRHELLSWCGVVDAELRVPDFELEDLRQAALAAAARTSLRGAARESVQIRCAIAHLARERATVAELPNVLCVSERSVKRLRARRPDPSWVRAIRGQLAWRSRPGREEIPAGAFAADHGEACATGAGKAMKNPCA